MILGQIPNGAMAERQMPIYSLVGSWEIVEPPVEPPKVEKIDNSGGAGFAPDDYYEEFEEIYEGKPPWKERSYRELMEVIEILTMVGFFE